MKKTLIALALMAGVSYAATTSLEDALVSQWGADQLTTTTSLTDVEGLTDNNFTYTFTLDPHAAALNIVGTNKNNKAITFVSVTDTANHIFGTGIGYSSNGEGIITQAGAYAQVNKKANETNIISAGNNVYFGGRADLFGSGSRTVDWDNLSGIAITLTHTMGTRTDIYITLSYDGEQADETFTAGSNLMKWSSGETKPGELGINTNVVTSVYLFDGIATAEQAFALNSAAIAATPEPATATLSLLALAGLAARRRRH